LEGKPGCGLLLVIYFLWDRREYRHESREDLLRDRLEVRPLRLAGRENIGLLLVVVAAVAFLKAPYRECAMLAAAVASYAVTQTELRQANRFSFAPLLEVGALFAGIFATMLPALDILRAHGSTLGVREPWHYFWSAGMLSSFLDNAPTYLTFLALAQGQGLPHQVVGVSHDVLAAISLGAVFMGANSYIGNGPNFMVRSIAEERGVPMPSFGGYMVYSGAILLPTFALVTLVFFR
jgi:Na+/H+ antiporter NhaD/arsenite permease-like protein